jgi:hypothetical protein
MQSVVEYKICLFAYLPGGVAKNKGDGPLFPLGGWFWSVGVVIRHGWREPTIHN